jgi:hypothetical protein
MDRGDLVIESLTLCHWIGTPKKTPETASGITATVALHVENVAGRTGAETSLRVAER